MVPVKHRALLDRFGAHAQHGPAGGGLVAVGRVGGTGGAFAPACRLRPRASRPAPSSAPRPGAARCSGYAGPQGARAPAAGSSCLRYSAACWRRPVRPTEHRTDAVLPGRELVLQRRPGRCGRCAGSPLSGESCGFSRSRILRLESSCSGSSPMLRWRYSLRSLLPHFEPLAHGLELGFEKVARADRLDLTLLRFSLMKKVASALVTCIVRRGSSSWYAIENASASRRRRG